MPVKQPEKSYNQIAGQKIGRIEALSDGVFAIAMTLLILDLKVPVSEAIHTERDLALSFCALTPKLLSYFMGFTTLGIFWVGQTTQHHFLERSDRNLSWLALFFLMFVSLVPFTTAFLSEHITFRFSIFIYWANIFALGAAVLANWKYAYRNDLLSLSSEERPVVDKAVTRRVVIAQALYAMGALLCFINIYLSIGTIILIQLNYALAPFERISKARADKKKLHSHS